MREVAVVDWPLLVLRALHHFTVAGFVRIRIDIPVTALLLFRMTHILSARRCKASGDADIVVAV